MKQKTFTVHSIEETKKLAKKLVTFLKGGEVICLIGDLGVGKTYFTKFLAQALGVEDQEIISPTFIYWRKYEGKSLRIHHFDFYRIEDEREVKDIGFEDALEDEKGVVVIEWADNIPSFLPKERLELRMKLIAEEQREITILAIGRKYEAMYNQMVANK